MSFAFFTIFMMRTFLVIMLFLGIMIMLVIIVFFFITMFLIVGFFVRTIFRMFVVVFFTSLDGSSKACTKNDKK
ncbi:MAG: hypothetical protein COA41_11905 [Sphingopyxis sp.]|nr:MAG: hypothetical protein COA41_11905 [Sphingopyxis sp.]